MNTSHGGYIAIIGIDGSGKSTQAGQLSYALQRRGYSAHYTESKEEHVINVMQAISRRHGVESARAYFTNEEVDIAKSFDTLRDHSHIIVPLVAAGSLVIAPRSGYCRIAVAMTHGTQNLDRVEQIIHFMGTPDLTVWLDASVNVAMARIAQRGRDIEDADFLHRYRGNLIQLHAHYQWPRIDANADVDTVRGQLGRIVDNWLIATGRWRDEAMSRVG